MDVKVRTGHTKVPRETTLTPLALDSSGGERVCLLMEVHGPAKEARAVERECETVVQHALLETSGDPAGRLDGTLKELNGLLKGFFASHAIEDAHMVLAILGKDGALHVSHAGRAEAYLIRRGVASQITEYAGKPAPVFVHIASGTVHARDTIILSTQRLLRAITPAQISTLSQHEEKLLDGLTRALDAEGEYAAVATMHLPASSAPESGRTVLPLRALRARGRSGRGGRIPSMLAGLFARAAETGRGIAARLPNVRISVPSRSLPARGRIAAILDFVAGVLADLRHPERRRRAHLLLLAGALALLVVVWVAVQLLTSSQRSKTRAELADLVEQIGTEIQTAENRRVIGDIDAANVILERAEERAKQVMDNESGLFRVEALDLLDRIREKREEINNITRLSPRVVANLSAKDPDISAQGIVGLSDGEFVVYDRRNLYRVLLNSIEDPVKIGGEELIVDGAPFARFSSLAFLTAGNAVVEFAAGQVVPMKTEDPAGWQNGTDIKAYLRYLYMLSSERKQVYKYERLSNRYGAPVAYNVNGDLTDAIDMAIDGNVYVLKEGGTVLKLFRGETQPFVIRRAPENAFADATKIFKVQDGNFYFLDPKNARVLVAGESGTAGESVYVKQFVLEGDQIGELRDFYVDPEETHLYVLDEKRVYAIDLNTK